MLISLLDINQLVKANRLHPINNPISFDKGMRPSSDGLFSNEIFGMTGAQRKYTCAYIPLGKKFISPKAYLSLTRLNRNFKEIVGGTKRYVIKQGVLMEDEEGGTGLDWLYANWEKIRFEKNDSTRRNQRIDFLKDTKKEEIFIDKFFVIPPFYRDVNLQQMAEGGSPKIPEVNNLYSAILRNVNLMKTSGANFLFMNYAMDLKTQDLMLEIYNLWKGKLEKKYGYIRKFLLGKSVNWCSRVVITANTEDDERPRDHNIDFYHTGVPLSHAISMTTPFMIYWIRNFFKTHLYDMKDKYPVKKSSSGESIYVKLENPEVYYNDEYIERQMERFINNPGSRFDKIEIPIKRSEKEKYGIKKPVYLTFVGYTGKVTTMQKQENRIERPMTWADLFYMAAVDVCADKHVCVTRYPFVKHLNQIFTRISLLSTRKTTPMIINDVLYETYPVIDFTVGQEQIESLFIDSFKINSLYLSGMTGDHDGDQITAKVVFSKQGNEDAERIMHSMLNIMSEDGSPIRTLGNELVQTLYTITRFRHIPKLSQGG